MEQIETMTQVRPMAKMERGHSSRSLQEIAESMMMGKLVRTENKFRKEENKLSEYLFQETKEVDRRSSGQSQLDW